MTIDRFQVTLPGGLERTGESTDPADWIPEAGLLVPRRLAATFGGNLWERETETREARCMGGFSGIALISNGAPSIHHFEITADRDSHQTPITSRFLERIPLTEIGLRVAARCALTRFQNAHYEVPLVVEDPFGVGKALSRLTRALEGPLLGIRQMDARREDRPLPVDKPPAPVLIDAEGIPWYRVQVLEEAVRSLSKRKRPRITDHFLGDVWAAYQTAREAGEPTTEAIRELGLTRTGKVPSDPTVFRWLKAARELHGQEAHDAEDK